MQAPHWPWSQPFLAPVSASCSRSTSSSEERGSSESMRVVPFTVSRTETVCAGSPSAPDRALGSPAIWGIRAAAWRARHVSASCARIARARATRSPESATLAPDTNGPVW